MYFAIYIQHFAPKTKISIS